MHVFTYGTLMFPEVWRSVVGRDFASLEATAAGFAIYRVANAVFPGITPAGEGEVVHGVLYLDVDQASVERLDTFEDTFYDRETIKVQCADGRARSAAAYVVPARNLAVLTAEPWDRDTFVSSGGLTHFTQRFQGFTRVKKRAAQSED